MHDYARRNLSLNLFILYQILLIPTSIFIIIASLFIKRIRRGLLKRFSISKLKYSGRAVIIHSSSLGEAKMAVKVASLIKKIKPDMNIIGSSFTVDGLKIMSDSNSFTDTFLYPIDIYLLIYLKLKDMEPVAVIFIEADLWPSLLFWCRSRDARVIIISGRITDRALRLMGVFRPIFSGIYRNVDRIFTANDIEYQKLRVLGINSQKMVISGSIKYMNAIVEGENKHNNIQNIMKKELHISGSERIIVAGSTHKGEEEIIIETYRNLKKRYNNLFLIIAPRYIEMTEEITNILKNYELKTIMYSHIPNNKVEWEVIVLDRIGLLAKIYSIAYIAFVGGSLVKRGGQNIMEPARYGVPVIFGPYVSNFRYESKVLISNSGGRIVRNNSELEHFISKLLDDENLYERFSKGAIRSYNALLFNTKPFLDEVKSWI